MRWLRQLGRGATAETWLVRSFGRLRAVKKPLDGASFASEARLASGLRHRNLVRVYGMRDELLFMEYVDGCDLRTLLRRLSETGAPPGLGAYVIAEVCRGLAHAHAQGLVHRDVSPANILLSRRGEVKLADFGVARDEGGNDTRTGSLRGNLAYMSPEQLDGKKVDLRADLFAAGVVLHECVRAKRLWKALDLQAMKEQRAQPVPPLDDVALDAVVRTALAQEFANAGEMARALETKFGRAQLAALMPEPAAERSRITRTQAPPRRRRYFVVAAVAVALAIAMAFVPRKKTPVAAIEPPAPPPPREQHIIVIDGPQPQKRPIVHHEKKPAPKLTGGQLLDPFHR